MTKKLPFFILFALGLVTGAFFYWLLSFYIAYRAENRGGSSRIIASVKNVGSCNQIKDINLQENTVKAKLLNIRCVITNKDESHGVEYKVKSIVTVKKAVGSDKAIVSVTNKLKGDDHITEADYCDEDCSVNRDVSLNNLTNANEVTNTLVNAIEEILEAENETIIEAVDESYNTQLKRERLKDKIANCEISKRSTLRHERKINPEEKMECRRNQLAKIENNKKRTEFFHSKVKPDLWYLISQDEGPLDKSFFLSEYMRDLKSPDFFSYDYFSIKSAIDTAEKYNDLRWFMEGIDGQYKKSALKSLSAQLPIYFYTNSHTSAGRQDRRYLENAWNNNFEQSPFPAYYSLSQAAGARPFAKGQTRMLPNEFRSIVNSPEFKRLYQ